MDSWGRVWPVIQTRRRLKFSYPAHAALRAHVFFRDGYKCVRCNAEAEAEAVPAAFDGSKTIFTKPRLKSGFRDQLVLDHILSLRAGGSSVIENLQTLCETCNKRKQRDDRAAAEWRKFGL